MWAVMAFVISFSVNILSPWLIYIMKLYLMI